MMQEKNQNNMNKALTWMKRWQLAGTTNMLKAIEVVVECKSDCIYLFTDGKADKPVLVMSREGDGGIPII
jgi:hypothetical protein